MKRLCGLFLLAGLITNSIIAQGYKHKSETEIARMTPAQRVEIYAEEQARHKYDVLDEYSFLVGKYLLLDGLKALPRMIEIMDEYDPNQSSGRKGRKGERFDACWMLLGYIDNGVVRLRGSAEGLRAIAALERAIARMRQAGYGQPAQHDWPRHGRFESAIVRVAEAKGLGSVDQTLKDTFRLEYKIIFTDARLLEFSNFLVKHYPDYPSWSTTNYFRDYTQLNSAGNPLWVYTMKQPARYHAAYLEFTKQNEQKPLPAGTPTNLDQGPTPDEY